MSDGGAGAFAAPELSGVAVARLKASDDRIVLTGASGWLGLATLELLRNTLGAEAFAARVVCFGSSARSLVLRGGAIVAQQPLEELAALPLRPTLLLHSAFLTKEKAEAMDDTAYVAANLRIRETVAAALDSIGVHALFVPSSGAARHAEDEEASPAMRLYGRLKRDDETAFAAWAQAGPGRTAAIVRVFNLSGPYINKPEHYALASFIIDAQAGSRLAVRATRPVMRSYVAIRELMSIVFGILTGPPQGAVHFDTAGSQALEMADVARAVAAAVRPVEVKRAALGDLPADNYVGSASAYETWRATQGVPAISFAEQVRETAAYLADARSAQKIS